MAATQRSVDKYRGVAHFRSGSSQQASEIDFVLIRVDRVNCLLRVRNGDVKYTARLRNSLEELQSIPLSFSYSSDLDYYEVFGEADSLLSGVALKRSTAEPDHHLVERISALEAWQVAFVATLPPPIPPPIHGKAYSGSVWKGYAFSTLSAAWAACVEDPEAQGVHHSTGSYYVLPKDRTFGDYPGYTSWQK